MKKQIKNVCSECGISANVLTCLRKHGRSPLKLSFDTSTFHKGICDYCGVMKFVTEVRDFFHPEFSLIGIVAQFLKGK